MSHAYNAAFNAAYLSDYLNFHLPEEHDFKQLGLMPQSDAIATMATKLAELELTIEHDDGSYDEIMERIVDYFKTTHYLSRLKYEEIVDRIMLQMVAELRVIVKKG